MTHMLLRYIETASSPPPAPQQPSFRQPNPATNAMTRTASAPAPGYRVVYVVSGISSTVFHSVKVTANHRGSAANLLAVSCADLLNC